MPPKAKKAAPAAADAKIDDAPKEGKAGRPRFPDWNSYERLAVAMAAMAATRKPDQEDLGMSKLTLELYGEKLDLVQGKYQW